MSYEEKGVWVYLSVAVLTFGGYVTVILRRAATTGLPLAEVPYVRTLLWAIGVSIAATIVTRIAVEIARPSDTYRLDERDRSVHRFGEYVGGTVMAVSMAVPLALTLGEAAYFWIANAIYLAFNLQAVVSSIVKIVAYRRGM
jgi:hypothetical protein